MGRSEMSTNVVKSNGGLCNSVSIINRRYIDHMKLVAYMTVSFITFLRIPLVLFRIIVYMVVCFVRFCLILQITYSYCYVLLLLSVCIIMYVPLWVSFYCVFLCNVCT